MAPPAGLEPATPAGCRIHSPALSSMSREFVAPIHRHVDWNPCPRKVRARRGADQRDINDIAVRMKMLRITGRLVAFGAPSAAIGTSLIGRKDQACSAAPFRLLTAAIVIPRRATPISSLPLASYPANEQERPATGSRVASAPGVEFGRLPIWLNEGLAQYFESMRIEKGRIVLGEAASSYGFATNQMPALTALICFGLAAVALRIRDDLRSCRASRTQECRHGDCTWRAHESSCPSREGGSMSRNIIGVMTAVAFCAALVGCAAPTHHRTTVGPGGQRNTRIFCRTETPHKCTRRAEEVCGTYTVVEPLHLNSEAAGEATMIVHCNPPPIVPPAAAMAPSAARASTNADPAVSSSRDGGP
jgi:hypothetical protein